jgi:hypothetical protein
MRVLIAEHDHARYAELLRAAAPEVEVLTSGDSAELARQAPQCPVWLGQPDLLASLLRQGHSRLDAVDLGRHHAVAGRRPAA